MEMAGAMSNDNLGRLPRQSFGSPSVQGCLVAGGGCLPSVPSSPSVERFSLKGSLYSVLSEMVRRPHEGRVLTGEEAAAP